MWASGDTSSDEPNTRTDAMAAVMQANVMDEAEHPGPLDPSA